MGASNLRESLETKMGHWAAEAREHAEEIARGRSLKNFLLLNDGWDGKDRSESASFRQWFDTVGAAKLTEWGFRHR